MKRTMLPLLGALAMACAVDPPATPTTPAVTGANDEGRAHTSADDGCGGLSAQALFGEVLPDDGAVRVRVNTTRATVETAHLAVFDHGRPVGEQELVASAVRSFTRDDRSVTFTVIVPADCGRNYQVDLGCGASIPVGARYTSNLVASWEVGAGCVGGGSPSAPAPAPIAPPPLGNQPPNIFDPIAQVTGPLTRTVLALGGDPDPGDFVASWQVDVVTTPAGGVGTLVPLTGVGPLVQSDFTGTVPGGYVVRIRLFDSFGTEGTFFLNVVL